MEFLLKYTKNEEIPRHIFFKRNIFNGLKAVEIYGIGGKEEM